MQVDKTRKGLTGKKFLLITFDYELFLGDRSGTVERCLIKPTDKLLVILNQYAFKAIFFIDTVYLLRLKEKAKEFDQARSDWESVTAQLIKMLHSGHEIHPHLHPHWQDAIYDPKINEWYLHDKRFYTFASLPEDQRVDLFDKSVALIHSILELAKHNQPVDAYRAGGWSIQPFISFKPHFQKHGIKHEFSVLPGRYCYSDAHFFDFRDAPPSQEIYHFSSSVCTKDDAGQFTEWTISSLPRNKFQRWFDFKINGMLHRLRITGKLNGSTVNLNIKEQGDIYSRDKMARHIASFEGLNPYRVRRFVRAIKKLEYFHFISHPKLIDGFESKMVSLLFRSLSKESGIETDFRKYGKVD